MKSSIIVRLLRLSIPIFLIGVLFKLMHWPFADKFMLISVLIVVLLYPIRFYLKKEKRAIDYAKLILLISFPINYYFQVFHLPIPSFLPYVSLISFIAWILLEFYDNYTSHISKDASFRIFPFGIPSVIILTLLIGVLYKVIGLPNARTILIFGFVALCICFIIDTFKPKK
jgi:hypothetical protein